MACLLAKAAEYPSTATVREIHGAIQRYWAWRDQWIVHNSVLFYFWEWEKIAEAAYFTLGASRVALTGVEHVLWTFVNNPCFFCLVLHVPGSLSLLGETGGIFHATATFYQSEALFGGSLTAQLPHRGGRYIIATRTNKCLWCRAVRVSQQ